MYYWKITLNKSGVLKVNSGCSHGVQSSAHITTYKDVSSWGKIEDIQIFLEMAKAFNSSSIYINVDIYGANKDIRENIKKAEALEGVKFRDTRVYSMINYVNSLTWRSPATTDKRMAHILILFGGGYEPLYYIMPKIQKLRRSGWGVFSWVYNMFSDVFMEAVASYPPEWHAFSHLKFPSSESRAKALVRAVCRRIEAKEHIAKKKLLSQVRLAGGNGPCEGRVEVLYNNTWSYLSDKLWDRRAADVVCRQLKCGPSVEAVAGDAFGNGNGHFLEHLDCTGDESDISQCLLGTWTEKLNAKSAGVTCLSSGISDVRLVDGSGSCDGIVEVSLNNSWSRLCLWNFNLREGAVICRQLGCGPLVRMQEVILGPEGQLVQRSRCSGTESEFSECKTSLWSPEPCLKNIHAGIVCSTKEISNVKLDNQSGTCSGKVNVQHNDLWSRVCAGEWTAAEEAVLCKQLGCGYAYELVAIQSIGWIPDPSTLIDFPNIHCGGHETNLSQCSSVLSPKYRCEFADAETSCSQTVVSDVRLMDGGHRCSGRVEVFYKKKWGTVCDTHWDLSDAEVVCRQVGCGPAVQAPGGAFFGPGVENIWLEKVFCNGTESALSQCGAVVSRKPLCVHSQDASVICKGQSLLKGN
ncbi:scavenger receptor cysteine-rich domain-containing group B protein-like [Gastrophryne carolinensis]